MYVFSSFVVRLLHVDFLCFFLYSCRNLVHIQQEFLNIVFSRVIFCICMQAPFLDTFGSV